MSDVKVKICGLSSSEAVSVAVRAGADLIGFVFYPASPRHVTPEQAAALAAPMRATGVRVVAVTVDADDAALDTLMSVLRPDLIQLHGQETPARAVAVKARTGAGIIKAIRVSEASDLQAAVVFEEVVDHLMFDAKPKADAMLPGGNGAAFDWSLMADRHFARPWFLAGGLHPGNVAAAVQASGAPMVDVSSGVEASSGVKNPVLVEAFMEAVRGVRPGGEAELTR